MKPSRPSLFSHTSPFKLLLFLDLLVLFLHLVLSHRWALFHLDYEWNVPTIYQSFKLLVFGLGFSLISIKNFRSEIRFFTVPLSLFLFGLGLDELLQIHENIYQLFAYIDWLHPSRIVLLSMSLGYRSSLWILYYLPLIFLFVFWIGYWFRYFQSSYKRHVNLILLSWLSFFVIILAEVSSSTGNFSPAAYFALITIEETAEMIMATSLIEIGYQVIVKRKWPSLRSENKSR